MPLSITNKVGILGLPSVQKNPFGQGVLECISSVMCPPPCHMNDNNHIMGASNNQLDPRNIQEQKASLRSLMDTLEQKIQDTHDEIYRLNLQIDGANLRKNTLNSSQETEEIQNKKQEINQDISHYNLIKKQCEELLNEIKPQLENAQKRYAELNRAN